MKPGKYSLKEMFRDRNVERILVPEIQRDYVWGKEQVIGLLDSIVTEFGNFQSAAYDVSTFTEDETLQQAFQAYYKKQKHATNIGFIYAYDDPHYAGNYFLIDGQQRLTTIYLLLLALAVDAGKAEEFRKLYFDKHKLKIDYKVRESAHDFFTHFVNFVLNGKSAAFVKSQNWYFDDYKNDVTISSICSNYDLIKEKIIGLQSVQFLAYIQDYIEFWYFDTNISEQGEELYIYMNARGEQIQSNENLKADLLAPIQNPQLKETWGKKWEDWQDYFWINRRENENADKGFNEFLSAIAGFENYIQNNSTILLQDDFEKDGIKMVLLKKHLSLEKIEKYLKIFQEVLITLKSCKNLYPQYHEWTDLFLKDWWILFNGNRSNWFADLEDTGRSLEHKQMVFFYSIVQYFIDDPLDRLENIRFLRLYYLRFSNNDRQVKSILSRVESTKENKVFNDIPTLNTKDELAKHKLYNSLSDLEILDYEQHLWAIEDHPHNLNGSGLEFVNITHLVDFTTKPELQHLELILDKFTLLFPSKGKGMKPLQTLLLTYGPYWHKVTPTNYDNYKCDDWRRIVRDTDSPNGAFKTFFTSYLNNSFEDIFQFKTKEFIVENYDAVMEAEENLPEMSLEKQLFTYSLLMKSIWEKGNFIAVHDSLTNPRLFLNEMRKISNTYKSFLGHSNEDLWDKCRNIYGSKKKVIAALKAKFSQSINQISA